MEENVRMMQSISDYCDMVGAQALHPLVSVVDFSSLPPVRTPGFRRLFGYYAVYLKGRKYSELHYGRDTYSYDEGALVFMAPGQVAGVEDDGVAHQMTTRVLMFHPDLLRGTYLQPLMRQYTFFSYSTNEALFPTEDEKRIIVDCFGRIANELLHQDESTMPIVLDYIKLVLDHCSRFYHRRFTTSQPQSQDILARLEQLLDDYFSSGAPSSGGVPTVAYCASRLCLSTNYLSDLVRTSTGVSALKVIHAKMLDTAKARLSAPSVRINEVATSLGFQQSQSFNAWFKKAEGCTPTQYRRAVMG